jgi:hypothetical protein
MIERQSAIRQNRKGKDTMANKTWFIDVDMTLQNPADDALIDDLMEAIEKLHGALAVGPGSALGLSLAVEAPNAWEAGQTARDFLEKDVAALAGQPALSSVRILDEATRTTENETPAIPHLVGVPDIAELLGVTRQQAGRLTRKPGFPHPALETRSGALWTQTAVEAWNEHTTRAVGRPARSHAGPSALADAGS